MSTNTQNPPEEGNNWWQSVQGWFGDAWQGTQDWFADGHWTGPAVLFGGAMATAVSFFMGQGLFGGGILGTMFGTGIALFVGMMTMGAAAGWLEPMRNGSPEQQARAQQRELERQRQAEPPALPAVSTQVTLPNPSTSQAGIIVDQVSLGGVTGGEDVSRTPTAPETGPVATGQPRDIRPQGAQQGQ